MLTRSIKKVKLVKPIVRFYICEDLRQELNGKMSAIGLYPDNVVVLRLPKEVPEPCEQEPIFVKSLGFLFNISNLNEDANVTIEIETDGKRKSFIRPQHHSKPGLGKSINMIGVLAPFPVTSFGKRKLYVTVEKTEHVFEFEIRRESISNGKAVKTPKKAVSKTSAAKVVVRKTKPPESVAKGVRVRRS